MGRAIESAGLGLDSGGLRGGVWEEGSEGSCDEAGDVYYMERVEPV